MGFDVITFIAQIVNLAILVWLLKRFLYAPIIRAVDNRQAYIHQKINEAKAEKEKWESDNALLTQTRADFEKRQKDEWAETMRLNDSLKKEQGKALKAERTKQLKRMTNELKIQRDTMAMQLQSIAESCTIDLLHKLARDFAIDSSVDKSIALFSTALKKVSSSEKTKMREALQKGETAIIYSATSLSAEQKKQVIAIIERELKETLQTPKFQHNDELIFGFRLQIGAYTADWNVKTYFNDIRRQFNDKTSYMIDEGLNA